MAIIRGTTPTLTFNVKDETLDLNEIADYGLRSRRKWAFDL